MTLLSQKPNFSSRKGQGGLIVVEQQFIFSDVGPSSPKVPVFLRCKNVSIMVGFFLGFIYLFIKRNTIMYKTGEVGTWMG